LEDTAKTSKIVYSDDSVPVATRREGTGIPTGKLATWWVIGSEIVIFGGLLACYLLYRTMYAQWSDAAVNTNVYFGTTNTVILLTSSLSAVLAHRAVEVKDHLLAFKYIWGTILGGCAFLVVKSIEWYVEISHGFVITKNTFWSFYYTAAGIHASHVIAGIIIMAIVSFDVKKGKNLHRVENMGNYWHFVDLVWIFLFPLLYIAK